MQDPDITNQNLMRTDFARKERIAFLASIPSHKPIKSDVVLHGLNIRRIWMTDVSILDRRSVKAQLAGRGDYRVFWWHLNDALERWIAPQSTLEQRMYAFHQRHHQWTINRLIFMRDFWILQDVIRREGVRAGLSHAIRQRRAAQNR